MLALVFVLSLWGATSPKTAAEPPPGYLAWKEQSWLAEIPPLPSDFPGLASPSASVSDYPAQSWSGMAFESGRDGNWEIYYAKGDGMSPRRLTDNPASDIYPRLDRGCTRVVFASDRDGNLELYTMNVDGSGLARLTWEPAADSWPAWSPDGTRIAFASRRDTDWDLYLMNADGSGVARLTASPEDDVQPCWSPDGQSIAWIRRVSSNQAELFRIDADGTNGRRIQPGCGYMQHPSWSVDGNYIAFDCDIDGDYFNEVVTTTEAGGGRTVLMDPSQYRRYYQDAWLGSYGPKDHDLVATIVYWEVEDGWLVLSRTLMMQLSGAWVSSSGLDMSPDWQTADIAAPIATLAPMPRFHPDADLLYSWSARDTGPAGIHSYDVEIRDQTNSDWRPWLHKTQDTSAWSHGGFGYTYRARVRAYDNAGNMGPWNEQPPEGTFCYRWKVSGTIVDERGLAVSNATAITRPEAPGKALPDREGHFAFFGIEGDVHQLEVSHQGYAAAAPIEFDSPRPDPQYEIRLWHMDERLSNGGGETGAMAPWITSGHPAPILMSDGLSGQYSFVLGQVITSGLYALPGNPDPPAPTQLMQDASGTLHVLYNTILGSTAVSHYLQRPSGGTWSTPQSFTDAGRWPALAMDASGTLYTVGLQHVHADVDYAMVYKYRPPGGEWTAAVRIPGVAVPATAYPVVLADSGGRLHAIWDCYSCWNLGTTQHAVRAPDGLWTNTTGPAVGWTNLPSRSLLAAIGTGDVMHAVWYDGTHSNGTSDTLKLMYSRREPGALWSGPVALAASSGLDLLREAPALLTGQGGWVYLIWQVRTFDSGGKALRQTAYLKRSEDGGVTWGSAVHISAWDTWLQTGGVIPAVTIDETGGLHAFWDPQGEQGEQSVQSVYSTSGDGGTTWSTPRRIGALVTPQSAIVQGQQGQACVGGRNALADVYGLNEVVGSSALRQTADLRSGAHEPTLAFSYRLFQEPDGTDSLKVSAGGEILWQSSGPQETWGYVWLDLSDWQGQTTTVTLELESSRDGDRSVAYVDNIALGSWMTPAVTEVTPAWVNPGEAVTVTVRGFNLLPGTVRLGAMEVTPTVTPGGREMALVLPGGLAPGKFTLHVLNSGGQEGYSSGAVTSGWIVYLPVAARH
jgi:hypothetical protein